MAKPKEEYTIQVTGQRRIQIDTDLENQAAYAQIIRNVTGVSEVITGLPYISIYTLGNYDITEVADEIEAALTPIPDAFLEGGESEDGQPANLIAAAPDLLAACQKFVDTWKNTNQREKLDVAARMAQQAIDKALSANQ